MMTKDEALRLALEALKEYTSVVTSVNDPNTWIKVADSGKPAREAITAIKAALEVPEEKYIYGTPLLDAMTQDYAPQPTRNEVLEEVAKEFDKMPFGDTSASFAIFVRNMKT